MRNSPIDPQNVAHRHQPTPKTVKFAAGEEGSTGVESKTGQTSAEDDGGATVNTAEINEDEGQAWGSAPLKQKVGEDGQGEGDEGGAFGKERDYNEEDTDGNNDADVGGDDSANGNENGNDNENDNENDKENDNENDSDNDGQNVNNENAGDDSSRYYAAMSKIPGFKQFVVALKSRKANGKRKRLGVAPWLKKYFFKKIDSDKSNTVSREEFYTALGRVSVVVGERTFDQLMDMFDDDGSGEIDVEEFTAALLPFFHDDGEDVDAVELGLESFAGERSGAAREWETEAYDFSSQGLRRLVVDDDAIAKDANNYWAPQVTRTLRVLNLSNNALSSLEIDLFLLPILPNLEELDLSRNEITRLGISTPLSKTKSIVALSMSPATAASSALASHGGAEEEKRSTTKIKQGAVFGFAPNLRSLNLEHNAIESIATEVFAASVRIETLLLGFNRLPEVQGLEMLKELEILGLESNRICRVVQLRSLSLNTELADLRLAGWFLPSAYDVDVDVIILRLTSHFSYARNCTGCPVMYGLAKRNRYKSSITSLLPCLMKIDGVVLPPSSERKRLSRMQKAQRLRDMATNFSSGRSPEFSGRNTPWRDINSEYEMMQKKIKASKARSAGVRSMRPPRLASSGSRQRSYTAVKRRGAGRSAVGSERRIAPPRRKLVYTQGSGTGSGEDRPSVAGDSGIEGDDMDSSAFTSSTKSVSELLSPHPTSVSMAAAAKEERAAKRSLPELYDDKGERVP